MNSSYYSPPRLQKTEYPSKNGTEKGTGSKSQECKMDTWGESAWHDSKFCLEECTLTWYLVFYEKGIFIPLRVYTLTTDLQKTMHSIQLSLQRNHELIILSEIISFKTKEILSNIVREYQI